MKKLNLITAIYSLVASIILLAAPLFTFGSIVSESLDGTGATAGSSSSVDMFFRVLAIIMIVLVAILLVKDKTASMVGKVFVLVCGLVVVIFSSLFGFIAGIFGIVGAALLLASNKKYSIIIDIEKE